MHAPQTPCPIIVCKPICLRNIATGEIVNTEKVSSISAGATTLIRYDNPADLANPLNPAEWEECPESGDKVTAETCVQSSDGSIYYAIDVSELNAAGELVHLNYQALTNANTWIEIEGAPIPCPCAGDSRVVYPALTTPANAADPSVVYTTELEALGSVSMEVITVRTPCDPLEIFTSFDVALAYPVGSFFGVHINGSGAQELFNILVNGTVVAGPERVLAFRLDDIGLNTVEILRNSNGPCDGEIAATYQIEVY